MRPGTLIDIYFPYKPPATGGKYRPALIISVSGGHIIAVAVKITKSKPSMYFPHRIKIKKWRRANLTSPSYAELDSSLAIRSDANYRYRGQLHPIDFTNILVAYNDYINR